ncbi:hypothetical protein Hanom_Chr10g00924611 [Helianthus anomalus]
MQYDQLHCIDNRYESLFDKTLQFHFSSFQQETPGLTVSRMVSSVPHLNFHLTQILFLF